MSDNCECYSTKSSTKPSGGLSAHQSCADYVFCSCYQCPVISSKQEHVSRSEKELTRYQEAKDFITMQQSAMKKQMPEIKLIPEGSKTAVIFNPDKDFIVDSTTNIYNENVNVRTGNVAKFMVIVTMLLIPVDSATEGFDCIANFVHLQTPHSPGTCAAIYDGVGEKMKLCDPAVLTTPTYKSFVNMNTGPEYRCFEPVGYSEKWGATESITDCTGVGTTVVRGVTYDKNVIYNSTWFMATWAEYSNPTLPVSHHVPWFSGMTLAEAAIFTILQVAKLRATHPDSPFEWVDIPLVWGLGGTPPANSLYYEVWPHVHAWPGTPSALQKNNWISSGTVPLDFGTAYGANKMQSVAGMTCNPVGTNYRPILIDYDDDEITGGTYDALAIHEIPSESVVPVEARDFTLDDPDIEISFDGGVVIKIVNSKKEKIVCLIEKGDLDHEKTVPPHDFDSVTLSKDIYAATGYITVTCRVSDGIVEIEKFHVYARVQYNLAQCWMCGEAIRDFAHLTWGHQASIIIFWVVLFLVIAKWSAQISYGMWKSWGAVKKTAYGIWVLIKLLFVNKYTVKAYNKVVNNMKYANEMVEKEMEMPADGGIAKTYQRKNANGFLSMALIGLLIVVVLGEVDHLDVPTRCDVSAAVSSELFTCSESMGVTSCKVSFSEQLTFKGVGSTACLMLTEKGKENPIGKVVLKLDGFKAEYPLQTEYYTSHWVADLETVAACPRSNNAHFCELTYNKCINSTDTLSGAIGGEAARHPGKTMCVKGKPTGSLVCAVTVTSTCIGGRGYVIPKGDVVRVSSIGTPNYVPEIHVWTLGQGVNANSAIQQHLILDETVKTVVGQSTFDVELIGEFNVPATNFDNKYVLRWHNKAAFSRAAERDNPAVNNIGDIQSQSPNNLVSPSRHSFIYDQDIFGLVFQDYVKLSQKKSGVSQLLKTLDVFPSFYDGESWDIDVSDGKLESYITKQHSVVISIVSDENWHVEFKKPKVCPDVQVATPGTIGGCYNCDENYAVVVLAKSNCDAGFAHVTSTNVDVLTTTIDLNSTLEKKTIIFRSKDGSEDRGRAHFNIEGSTTQVSFEIDYKGVNGITLKSENGATLVHTPANKDNMTEAGNDIEELLNGSYFDTFWLHMADAFKGAGGFIDYVLISAASLVILVIMILLAYGFMSFRANKAKRV